MNAKTLVIKSVLAASLALSTTVLSFGKIYSLEILNINYFDTDAAGLNNNGQIVGTATGRYGAPMVAFRYDNLTKKCSVVIPPAAFMNPTEVVGTAINSTGTIIGTYSHPPTSDSYHVILHSGFCTYADGTTFSLDDYQDGLDHSATAITDNGLILESANITPISTGPSSYFRNLFGLKVGQLAFNFVGAQMNESFVVAGNDKGLGAAIYNCKTNQENILRNNGFTEGFPHAAAINKLGIVSGIISLPDNEEKGFLTNGSWHILFGSSIASVHAMNNVSDVVGELDNGGPFIYEYSTGHFLHLNQQLSQGGWTLRTATGINDYGQICGQASRPARFGEPSEAGFIYKAYLLTPVTFGGIIKSPPTAPGRE